MDKQQKIQLNFDNYWLTAILHSKKLQIVIISTIVNASKKYSIQIEMNKDLNPVLKVFETCQQLYKLIKIDTNHSFHTQTGILTLKWKIVANQFQKQINCQIKMNQQEFVEVDRLKIENYLLKRKLEKYQKLENQKNNIKSNVNAIDQIITEKKTNEQKNNITIQCLSQSFTIQKQQKVPQKKQSKTKKTKALVNKLKNEQETGINQSSKPKKRGRRKATVTVKKNQQAVKGRKSQQVNNMVKISFQNGDYYYGEVKDNLYHGHGLYYSATNGIFQGEWEYGKANGYGVSKDPSGNQHTGFYVNDKRNGKGVDVYPNGQRYEGEFESDAKSGKGKYYYANGDIYQGEWKNDLYHGYGKERYHDGSMYEGTWICDQKDGTGIFTDLDGKRYRQIWDKGSKIKEEQIRTI